MPSYSTPERQFLVKTYYENGKNLTLVLRKWSSAFKNKPKPSRSCVIDLIAKFERTGSVIDIGRDYSNTARIPETIKFLEKIMDDDPQVSVRRASQTIGSRRSSTHTMMRNDLERYPYKIQVKHTHKPTANNYKQHVLGHK